ncbi:MAG TPA: hypothetical protein EYQ18_25990 [Candidatus Handelsmanbacteria bacterium]|nr:hypothetical protein [Candidatus Handelsmanbacteria bacterium]
MKETEIRNEIHRIIDAGLETEGEITLDRAAVEVAHRPRRPVSSDQSCRRLFVSGWSSSAIIQPGAYQFVRPGGGVQCSDWKVTLQSEKVEWSYRDHGRHV